MLYFVLFFCIFVTFVFIKMCWMSFCFVALRRLYIYIELCYSNCVYTGAFLTKVIN